MSIKYHKSYVQEIIHISQTSIANSVYSVYTTFIFKHYLLIFPQFIQLIPKCIDNYTLIKTR